MLKGVFGEVCSMIVDFATHFHPEEVLPPPMLNTELLRKAGPALWDIEVLTRYLDDAGIDAAVLSQPFYMGHHDLEGTARANDALLDVIADDERYYGLASIPTACGGRAAADELERSLERGFHGGALETESNGIELIDDTLFPVYDVAVKWDAPVMVHPKLDESLGPDVLDEALLLNATFGRETALVESLSKVVHCGILDDYPDLKLVYHHLGGNIASMLGRVHLLLDPDRWPGQERVKPYAEFKNELANLYLDTSGYMAYPAPLRAALREFPSTNIVLGTDCPFEARTAGEMHDFVALTEELAPDKARDINGQNALDLLINHT